MASFDIVKPPTIRAKETANCQGFCRTGRNIAVRLRMLPLTSSSAVIRPSLLRGLAVASYHYSSPSPSPVHPPQRLQLQQRQISLTTESVRAASTPAAVVESITPSSLSAARKSSQSSPQQQIRPRPKPAKRGHKRTKPTISTAAALAAEPSRGPFTVGRTPSNNLPVYHLTKRGGTLKQTEVKKIEGDPHGLRVELIRDLGFPVEDVRVNSVTGAVKIKGWHQERVKQWLGSKGF